MYILLTTMRDLVRSFRALSDETRIRILKILLQRECCVCEVMQALDISQSRASRNLGILEDAGFIKSRREGLWILYSIDEQRMNSYAAPLIELLRGSLVNEEVILQDKERLKYARRVGPRATTK
jgi:ArsR family transcriptional regulator